MCVVAGSDTDWGGGLTGWRKGINQAFDLNRPSWAWGRDNGGDWSSPTDIATTANYLLIGALLWLCLLTALSPTQSLTMSPLIKSTATLAFKSLYAHIYMGYTMHVPCKICEAHIYFSPCAHGLAIPLVNLPQQKAVKKRKTSKSEQFKVWGGNGHVLFDFLYLSIYKQCFTHK